MLRSTLLAMALAVGFAANASASMFAFNYQTGFGLLTIDVDGTLQPDNNSFIVSGLNDVIIAGTPQPAFVFVGSADVAIFGAAAGLSGSTAALVTLDGSAMDIAVCFDASCASGILISAGATEIATVFGSVLVAGGDAGDLAEPFTPSGRTFSAETDAPITPVPAPGGVALFGLALLGLGMVSRRRA